MRRNGPNWTMVVILIVSIGIHAWFLGHLAGLYRSESLSYIEIALEEKKLSTSRSIPRPPQRTKPQLPNMREMEPVKALSVKPSQIPPGADAARVSNSLPEAIPSPEKPEFSKNQVFSWSPRTEGMEGIPPAYGTHQDYFSMIRMKIESNKKYPPSALRKQMQGRVGLSFTISKEGTVERLEVKQPSRYQVLDEAAQAAVKAASPFPRPPPQLFQGPVSVEITIVFELM